MLGAKSPASDARCQSPAGRPLWPEPIKLNRPRGPPGRPSDPWRARAQSKHHARGNRTNHRPPRSQAKTNLRRSCNGALFDDAGANERAFERFCAKDANPARSPHKIRIIETARRKQHPSHLDRELVLAGPCAFVSAPTRDAKVPASSVSLLESCPRNGDVPKSPLTHWQRWCHRLTQLQSKNWRFAWRVADCIRQSAARDLVERVVIKISTKENTDE